MTGTISIRTPDGQIATVHFAGVANILPELHLNGGGVAFFGHVGGFVFGAIVARALSRGETLERSRRVAVTTSRR